MPQRVRCVALTQRPSFDTLRRRLKATFFPPNEVHMSYPTDRRYTQEHEWARQEGDVIVIGITQHAQSALGDVVYVELPGVGSTITAGESFGVVESTKAVSELFAPLTGEVVEVNSPLEDAPETVNSDPHGAAWIIKVRPEDATAFEKLLTADAYEAFLASEA